MEGFERGVRFYTEYETPVIIRFVEDRICCEWCNRSRCGGKGHLYCVITGEEMAYPAKAIGNDCPLRSGSRLISQKEEEAEWNP